MQTFSGLSHSFTVTIADPCDNAVWQAITFSSSGNTATSFTVIETQKIEIALSKPTLDIESSASASLDCGTLSVALYSDNSGTPFTMGGDASWATIEDTSGDNDYAITVDTNQSTNDLDPTTDW